MVSTAAIAGVHMTRANFSPQTKRDAYDRSQGICECHRIPHLFPNPCGQPFDSKGIEYDHIDPDAISKRNDLDNCATLRRQCHSIKTKTDRKVIAKSNHVQDKARGIKPAVYRPLTGTKASGIKLPLKPFARPLDRRTGREL